MAEPISRDVLRKVRKLAQLPEEARQSQVAVSVTRLTVLKSLCQEAEVANRFVTYLARNTLRHVEHGQGRSGHAAGNQNPAHHQMMAEALAGMEAWQERPTETVRQGLVDLRMRMRLEQNEHKKIAWGSVRLINDSELLLFEYALSCLLHPPHAAGTSAYQTARHYAERYDSRHGTGLTPASAPLLQDIADFWTQEFDLGPEALTTPARVTEVSEETPPSPRAGKGKGKKVRFTYRQGQFLAFIHWYRIVHRRAPAELDMVQFFRVTPPSVHGMVVKLEQLGLITREKGVPRSIRVAIPEKELPELDPVNGPPW